MGKRNENQHLPLNEMSSVSPLHALNPHIQALLNLHLNCLKPVLFLCISMGQSSLPEPFTSLAGSALTPNFFLLIFLLFLLKYSYSPFIFHLNFPFFSNQSGL